MYHKSIVSDIAFYTTAILGGIAVFAAIFFFVSSNGKENQIKKQVTAITKLKTQVEKLTKDNEQLDTDKRKAIRDLSALKKEIEDHTTQSSSKEETLQYLQKTLAEKQESIDQLEKDLMTSRQETADALADKDAAVSKIKSDMQRTIAAQNETIARLKSAMISNQDSN